MKVDINKIKYYQIKSGTNEGKYHYRYDRGSGNYMHIGRFDHLLTVKESVSAYKKALNKLMTLEDQIASEFDIDDEYDEFAKHREENNREARNYKDPDWWKEKSLESRQKLFQRFPTTKMYK